MDFDVILPPLEPIATATFIEYDTLSVYKKRPLLPTKWHQDEPYNNNSPVVNGVVCPAGCGVIAVAQLLMYHKHPADSICINNEWFEWSLLSRYHYITTVLPSTAATAEVAAFVRAIGIGMEADYAPGGTGTSRYNARNLLDNVLPSASVSLLTGLDENIVKDCLNANNPVLARGQRSGSNSGHMWVIDGHCTYTLDAWDVLKDTSVIPYVELSRTYRERKTAFKLHCNFGWGGRCDGYYTPRVFDTRYALNNADIERFYGDYAGIGGTSDDYDFNSGFAIITCSLN